MKKHLQIQHKNIIYLKYIWLFVFFYSSFVFSQNKTTKLDASSLVQIDDVVLSDSISIKPVLFISEGTIVSNGQNISINETKNTIVSKENKITLSKCKVIKSEKSHIKHSLNNSSSYRRNILIINSKEIPEKLFSSNSSVFLAVIPQNHYRFKLIFFLDKLISYNIFFIKFFLITLVLYFTKYHIKSKLSFLLFSRPPPYYIFSKLFIRDYTI